MEYIQSMIAALNNGNGKYKFELKLNDAGIVTLEPTDINIGIPTTILSFYGHVHSLKIFSPRSFEIFSMSEITWRGPFVSFSKINSNSIGFDCRKINSAGEWDIVNLDTKFVITKTLASYLTNKMWAWINRGRLVWCQEY